VHAHTHDFIATGQDDSKFGFNLGNGDAAKAIVRIQNGASDGAKAGELIGVHCHIGSNVLAVNSFAKAAEIMAEFSKPYGLPELTLGGGLGVAYTEGEEAPTITMWGSVLLDACETLGVTAEVSVEPGRAIVASSAITVYRVGTVKEIPGIRTYISVDGGMSDNPRPVLYGSGYEAFKVSDVKAERPLTARLVGKHCESGDILIFEGQFPSDIAVDDLIATPVTGAYGHSMASNYNKVPRPAVVFVANGASRLVIRRETYEDLVRLDVS
jgi:diaminopimelate decarboxylase